MKVKLKIIGKRKKAPVTQRCLPAARIQETVKYPQLKANGQAFSLKFREWVRVMSVFEEYAGIVIYTQQGAKQETVPITDLVDMNYKANGAKIGGLYMIQESDEIFTLMDVINDEIWQVEFHYDDHDFISMIETKEVW